MSRIELAYLLLTLFVVTIGAVFILSRRFVKYRRALERGRYGAKPAWKPFWMN
jgi:hypothetical protein